MDPQKLLLHKKFRLLTIFLRVAVSLNYGQLSLTDDNAPKREKLTERHHSLKAMASILVTNNENLAAIAFSAEDGQNPVSGGLVVQDQMSNAKRWSSETASLSIPIYSMLMFHAGQTRYRTQRNRRSIPIFGRCLE